MEYSSLIFLTVFKKTEILVFKETQSALEPR